jgi:hypothetical protein
MMRSAIFGLLFVLLLIAGAALRGFRLAHWDVGRLRDEREKLGQIPPMGKTPVGPCARRAAAQIDLGHHWGSKQSRTQWAIRTTAEPERRGIENLDIWNNHTKFDVVRASAR